MVMKFSQAAADPMRMLRLRQGKRDACVILKCAKHADRRLCIFLATKKIATRPMSPSPSISMQQRCPVNRADAYMQQESASLGMFRCHCQNAGGPCALENLSFLLCLPPCTASSCKPTPDRLYMAKCLAQCICPFKMSGWNSILTTKHIMALQCISLMHNILDYCLSTTGKEAGSSRKWLQQVALCLNEGQLQGSGAGLCAFIIPSAHVERQGMCLLREWAPAPAWITTPLQELHATDARSFYI